MIRYHIIRGLHGGLVVSNQEPPSRDRWVEGPFFDHNEAFDRMEELSVQAGRRRALVEVALLLLAMGAGLGTLNVVAG